MTWGTSWLSCGRYSFCALRCNGSQEQGIHMVYVLHSLWGERWEKARLSSLEEVRDYNLTASGYGFEDLRHFVVNLPPPDAA